MLEDLFLTDTPTEAGQSEVELDENIEKWPEEIQNILMTQLPVLNQVPGQLNFDAVDQDKLYAKGSYTIPADPEGKTNVVIPVLVQNGKLLPMDVFLYNDEFRYLDPEALEEVLMSPALGDELMADEDIPAAAYTGFSNKVTPPGAYGSGYVNSYANKTGSFNYAKVASDLHDVLKQHPTVLAKVAQNPAASFVVDAMLQANSKTAGINGPAAVSGNKVIVNRGRGDLVIKSAELRADGTMEITETPCDVYQLTDWMKHAGLKGARRILNDLQNSGMAFTWEDKASASNNQIAPVEKAGSYTCYTSTDLTPVNVTVLKVASAQPEFLAISENGSYSLQSSLVGKPSEAIKTAALKTTDNVKVNDTVTFWLNPQQEYMTPVKVASVVNFSSESAGSGTTITGWCNNGKVAVVRLDNKTNVPWTQAVKLSSLSAIPKEHFTGACPEVWYIPSSVKYIKLAGHTPLVKTAEDYMAGKYLASGMKPTVGGKMWKTGTNSYAVKLGSAYPQMVDAATACVILKQAGESNVLEEVTKLASGNIKSFDYLKDSMTKAKSSASKTKNLMVNDKKRSMDGRYAPIGKSNPLPANGTRPIMDKAAMLATLKVAAAMDDDETIDTVLSLNYVTPENMEEFKLMLPDMENTEKGLARLLLSIRLGNNIAEEQDIRKVLDCLHEVIKTLKSRM